MNRPWRIERGIPLLGGPGVAGWVVMRDHLWWRQARALWPAHLPAPPWSGPMTGYYRMGRYRLSHVRCVPTGKDFGPHCHVTGEMCSADEAWDLMRTYQGEVRKVTRSKGHERKWGTDFIDGVHVDLIPGREA